jgi:antitoxin PrlF
MREIVASVTSRGQVTIPATVRRQLGINTPDKIAFVLHDDGRIDLKPVELNAITLSGIVPAFSPESPGDFEDLIEEAMQDEADRIMAKMRRQ